MLKEELEAKVKRGRVVRDLLLEAGLRPDFVRTNRAFSSQWAWDDGSTVVATVWLHEMTESQGVLTAEYKDPNGDSSLSGQRLTRARDRFKTLSASIGSPLKALVQRLNPDWQTDPTAPKARERHLDDVPWFAVPLEGRVRLQRGFPPPIELEVDRSDTLPEPSQARDIPAPSYSERENRPEQPVFRLRVASKTGNRCALTGAPLEVCDGAHFAWADWRVDNEAHHGVLLRADLHAALDKGLIEIDQTGNVSVGLYLQSFSEEYRRIHRKRVPI
jgi:hypothetical protein